MILAGDIGGTKCTLALFEMRGVGTLRPRQVEMQRFPSREHAHLEDIVEEFTKGHRGKIRAAGFGVAGPVIGDHVRTTNLPWLVDGSSLARLLGIPRTALLNDLEATGHGLGWLEPHDAITLNQGEEAPQANQALIAAGTGLGEAILFFRGGRRWVAGTEGGHSDFAPRTEEEIELLRFAKKRFASVSWENLLSGSAFQLIHEFLAPSIRHASFDDPTMDSAKEISQLADSGQCAICAKTQQMWVALYGAEAGNLALKSLARGGVFVAGGIAVKLQDEMRSGRFVEAFCTKSRFHDLLAAIPIYLVVNEETPVLGAAAVAAEQATA